MNHSKLIKTKFKCINNCSEDEIYKYEYNNICYTSCPNGTHSLMYNQNLCVKDLECEKYFNYEQTECINEVPIGYYLNDSLKKTIDKCHPDCKTCNIKGTNNNSNCLTCPSSKYFYYGNCISSCIYAYF